MSQQPPWPNQPQGWPQQPYGPSPGPYVQGPYGQPPQRPYAYPGPQNGGPPPQRAWLAQHKILTGLGASVALVIAIAIIGAVAGSGANSTKGCNASSCVVVTVQKSLTGMVAKDESVITGITCQPGTVRQNPGQTWTVACTATYSDGRVSNGLATIVVSEAKVTWEPTGMVSAGS